MGIATWILVPSRWRFSPWRPSCPYTGRVHPTHALAHATGSDAEWEKSDTEFIVTDRGTCYPAYANDHLVKHHANVTVKPHSGDSGRLWMYVKETEFLATVRLFLGLEHFASWESIVAAYGTKLCRRDTHGVGAGDNRDLR